MKVQPVEGRLLRDPQTGREILGPTEVSDADPFYLRAIANGDLAEVPNNTPAELVDPAAQGTAKAAKGAAK